MCPHCKGRRFYNSWGFGNALCANCNREFNVVFVDGQMTGKPVVEVNRWAYCSPFPDEPTRIGIFNRSEVAIKKGGA